MPPRFLIPAALMAILLGADGSFAQAAPLGSTGHPGYAAAPPRAVHAVPGVPGQDAFGAVQEIVRMLLADPATDWSRVNIDALREHLVDMHEVTLRAAAAVQRVEAGIEVTVTGEGRTLAAIRRMIPAHAREIDGRDGWRVTAASRPDAVTLTVTSADPRQVAIIRGLGFMGVMATGSHHQAHHLAMARGELHLH